jgi:glycosyltransferase involved in cell wall biosynthesis
MNILHVNKFFGHEGGAELYLHRLMEAQREAGHEVHVFSTRSPQNSDSPDAKYFVERMNLDRREGWRKDARKAMRFLWNREASKYFIQMLDEMKPDVVHLHNIYHHLSSSILAPIRERAIPCVMTLHDYKLANPNYSMFCHGTLCVHSKDGHYWELVRRRCLGPSFSKNALAAIEMKFTKWTQAYERSVKFFLCPSRFMKRTMEEWGEPSSQLRYLPNPVAIPEGAACRGGGYLLYAGRLSPEKGLHSLIEASARVREVPLRIAGAGPEERALRELARSLKATHIAFLGFLSPAELTAVRRRAEAVVLPSLSPENASGSLLEAMADGIPCLTTRVGGNPELVEDEMNGFLVEPGDVDDWERVIRRFVGLPVEVRDEMGNKGREKVEKYHRWDRHLEALDAMYQEARG